MLGHVHSCNGSPYMEGMQRWLRPMVSWCRPLAGPTAVIGHHVRRGHRDSPGRPCVATDTRPGPQLQLVTMYGGHTEMAPADALLVYGTWEAHSCDGSLYMQDNYICIHATIYIPKSQKTPKSLLCLLLKDFPNLSLLGRICLLAWFLCF